MQRNSFCSRADVAGELHRAGTALVLPHSLQRVGLHVRDAAFLFEPRASPLPVGPAADFICGSTGELPPVRDIWGPFTAETHRPLRSPHRSALHSPPRTVTTASL